MLMYVLQHFTTVVLTVQAKWQIPFYSLDKHGLEKDSQWSITFSLLLIYWGFFTHVDWKS